MRVQPAVPYRKSDIATGEQTSRSLLLDKRDGSQIFGVSAMEFIARKFTILASPRRIGGIAESSNLDFHHHFVGAIEIHMLVFKKELRLA